MISILRNTIGLTFLFAIFVHFSSCQTKKPLIRPGFSNYTDSLKTMKPFGEETINKLLKKHNVNGVSIAYVNYNKKGWSKSYGFADAEKKFPIDSTTQFQAASISKVFTALAVMELVQQEYLSLDDDLRVKLEEFGIENQFPETILSLRNLLKHKAGISYTDLKAYKREEELPTLNQILQGMEPAKNDPIQVTKEPYKTSEYSEGGYVILEKLINSLIAERDNPAPFNDLLYYGIIRKLHLKNTTISKPKDTSNIAFGHSREKEQLEGKFYVYPETGAAGIWTTAHDLAQLAIEIAAYRTEQNKILNYENAEEFATEGLGVTFDNQRNLVGSFGRNHGYSCLLTVSLTNLNGLVIMTNSEDGGALMNDINALFQKQYYELKKKTEEVN